jgi:small multidrug resistance family-3 protein
MGVYISIFFVVSQAIAIIAFHEKPKMPILVGGALIVAGGLVISLWKPAG